MPKYDFHHILEPLEFEALVCDIVRVRDNIFLETYKEGRDMGIDGSYIKNGEKIIVQVKRYKDYKSLLYQLKDIELPKVRKLNPTRYILGVSMDFGPDQKNKIKELFEGYIIEQSDIISANDINNLLKDKKYKWIERSYPKLWIPSVNVLSRVLDESVHKPIYKESSIELKEAFRTADFFVPTRIYRQALSKWEQSNVIILSGEPGVGKTTMARLLALAYLQPNNFEGFIWVNSIDDVYKVFEEEQKQVIIFDDFWGNIFYDDHRARKNENRLNQLIKNIIGSRGEQRLILTTREYVLQQGLQKHPLLKETLEKYSLICMVEEYGYDEKASILFRHLYTSKLNYEFISYLFRISDRIIYHENYNPRVLALFLDKESNYSHSPADYFEELLNYLDNPEDFWKEVFIELSPEARIFSILLMISTTPMRINDMNLCYQKFIHHYNNPLIVKSLGDCIKELEKSVIKTFYNAEEDTILIKFCMPAVQDFLYKFISENTEQYIPLILNCCAYYNQLQYLLEHYSKYSSKFVENLIIQECIAHYYNYDDCYLEYYDDLDLDIATNGEQLHRFFDSIRICDPITQTKLFNFLEKVIKEYCLTMGNGNLAAQYIDLQNLPDIIARCVEKGMEFNGEKIIEKYYEQAFSIYHYIYMEKFQEVFPEEFNSFKVTNYNNIKSNLKNIILAEIEFLKEKCRDYELDLLVEDIPYLLKDFGLRYTEKFGNQIYEICGRIPSLVNDNKDEYKSTMLEDYIDREELDLEVVKVDAQRWLFGPREIFIEEDQIVELILNSGLKSGIIEELIRINESGTPHFVYNMLNTKESFNILIQVIQHSRLDKVPEKESYLSMLILYEISGRDKEILSKLLDFCAETSIFFMYQEEPILRKDYFLCSEVYEIYLKDDPEIRNIVFDNLILSDEQWIRFIHVHVFIFCHAFIVSQECDEGKLQEYFVDLCGENFFKLRHVAKNYNGIRTSIGYVEFGPYYLKNYYWEGIMYRIVEELIPSHFNKFYTKSKLENYLGSLGKDDDIKVMKHISICKYQLEYDESGEMCGHSGVLNDELSLIDHLGIAEEPDFHEISINLDKLQKLSKIEEVCFKDEGKWTIKLHEIKDIELIKELGFYEEILRFIKEVEFIYSRLSSGIYSLTHN